MSVNAISFKDYQALLNYSASVNYRHDKGEIIFVENENAYYIYDGEWKPIPAEAMTNSGLEMNLYELNKSVVAALPIMTADERSKAVNKINEMFTEDWSNYQMLLCKDISYYTIFNRFYSEKEFSSLGEAVETCLIESFGNIIAIDKVEDKDAFEIWVRTYENEIYCMYLFDCEALIVGYGG